MAPKISIVTAAYNSEKYIEETIKSVISQTYDNIEYLIIDGDSQDATLKIVKKYQDKIDILISEPDEGIYDAFNKGIAAASGDVIYFLNSDDYLYDENVISDIAAQFSSNVDAQIVYGNVESLDEQQGKKCIVGKKATLEDLARGVMPPHQAFFVKKEVFYQHGFFNLGYKYASDYDFVVKCIKHNSGRALYYDRVAAVFRESGVSHHYKTQKASASEVRAIVEKHFGKVENELIDYSDYYFKMWLEYILLQGKPLTERLKQQAVAKVVIFGTMQTAKYLLKDLQLAGISVLSFIDNNERVQGTEIEGIEVVSAEWLIEHGNQVDAVLLSFQADYEDSVKQQIAELLTGIELEIVSWKDLVKEYIGEAYE